MRSALGVARRLLVGAVLLVPCVVDPWSPDTQLAKAMVVALCGTALLVLGALATLTGRRRPAPPTAAEVLLVALLGWGALSLLWAHNPGLGVLRLGLLLGVLGVARALHESVRRAGAARRLLVVVVTVGLASLGADALAMATDGARLAESEAKHASVLFVHNNMAASYAMTLAPLLVALAFGAERRSRRLLWAALLAGLFGYMLLLRSRAGLLGAALSLPAVGLLFALRGRLARLRPPGRWGLAALAALVVAGAFLPLSDGARGIAKDAFFAGVRAFDLEVGDASFRPRLWRRTIEMTRESPLTGVGAGGFAVEYPRYERESQTRPHAHNDGLQMLAELGVPGLLILLAMLAAALVLVLGVLRGRSGREAFTVGAGLAGLWLALVVSGQFEVPLALGPTAAGFAVLLGLAGGLARDPAAESAGPPRPGERFAALVVLVAAGAMLWLLVQRAPASRVAARAEDLAAEGRLDEAIALHERVVAMQTGTYHPWRRIGLLELERGDGAAALAAFRSARALWPHTRELAEDEGDALAALGRFPEAVDRYREAYEGSPERRAVLFKLVRALDEAGELRAAIDKLEFVVRSDTGALPDSVRRLMDMWRRQAEAVSGEARVEALAAARHFAAVLIEEGPAGWWPEVNALFKDLTHQLQVLPGGLSGWWPLYERYLDQGGWNMPYTALYTSIDRDAKRLFPGWDEPEGPPLRGAWRRR